MITRNGWVYFNNHPNGSGAKNGLKLKEMVQRTFSNFQKRLSRFFQPLNYLVFDSFNFLPGVFTANSTFPYKTDPSALVLIKL